MARSLPLENAAETIIPIAEAVHAPTDPTVTVAVYDPAMCCSTGVCGPGVDPALMTIARDLRWLEKQGVNVLRRGLAQEPDAFVSNTRVSGLMQAFGDAALPAVLVNGEVLCYGRYPSREELTTALSARAEAKHARSTTGCAPGSGCC